VKPGAGVVGQCRRQLHQQCAHAAHLVAHVQPQVVRRLVVARPAGPDLAAGRAHPLDEHALEERVHVLIGGGGPQRPGGHVDGEHVEGAQERGQLRVVEQAGAVQFAHVRSGAVQVVGRHGEVARVRPGEPGQLRARPSPETPAPKGTLHRHSDSS
jgi:hypothetical protein